MKFSTPCVLSSGIQTLPMLAVFKNKREHLPMKSHSLHPHYLPCTLVSTDTAWTAPGNLPYYTAVDAPEAFEPLPALARSEMSMLLLQDKAGRPFGPGCKIPHKDLLWNAFFPDVL